MVRTTPTVATTAIRLTCQPKGSRMETSHFEKIAAAIHQPVYGIDRRSLNDQRRIYNLDYFLQGGSERRQNRDRRTNEIERRDQWVRIGKWSSIYTPLLVT